MKHYSYSVFILPFLLYGNTALSQTEPSQSNFVPGDRVIFFDSLKNETIGEFPSKWDLVNGSIEIVDFEGNKAIGWRSTQAVIKPLMRQQEYLPEQFTLEFEAYFFYKGNEGYYVTLNGNKNLLIRANINSAYFNSTANTGKAQNTGFEPGWRKYAISFNKRALKIFLNDERLLNIPNITEKLLWLEISALSHNASKGFPAMIRNIRIAEGGIPLYDQLITDGKFITYGILFDVNKTEIKPESQSTINQIANMLKDHPAVRVRIEGHTDSDGADEANTVLSENRALAVKNALAQQGVEISRMETRGLGETQPVGDNNTSEGKALNRRVVFVLLQ